jgi:predicted metallopeptidase
MENELIPQKNMEYKPAPDVEELVKHMRDIEMFPKIKMEKMVFLRSTKKEKVGGKKKVYASLEEEKMAKEIEKNKNKRKWIARVVTLSKFWKEIYKEKAVHYVVEVASECYDELSPQEKKRTIIHELNHIPLDFEMGSLRPHDEFKEIHMLYNKYNELVQDEKSKV